MVARNESEVAHMNQTSMELKGDHVLSHSLCPSKDVRDAIIATGMEHGMRESMDQLDELATLLAQSEGRVAK